MGGLKRLVWIQIKHPQVPKAKPGPNKKCSEQYRKKSFPIKIQHLAMPLWAEQNFNEKYIFQSYNTKLCHSITH